MNTRDVFSKPFRDASSGASLNRPELRQLDPLSSPASGALSFPNPSRPEGMGSAPSLIQAERPPEAQEPERLAIPKLLSDTKLYLEANHPRIGFSYPRIADIKVFFANRIHMVHKKTELHSEDRSYSIRMLQAAYLEQACIEACAGQPDSHHFDLDSAESKVFWEEKFETILKEFSQKGLFKLENFQYQSLRDFIDPQSPHFSYGQSLLAALGMRKELPYCFRKVCIDSLRDESGQPLKSESLVLPDQMNRPEMKQRITDKHLLNLHHLKLDAIQKNASRAIIKGELEAMNEASIEVKIQKFLDKSKPVIDDYRATLNRLRDAYANQPVRLEINSDMLTEESKKNPYFVYWQRIASKLCEEYGTDIPIFNIVKQDLIESMLFAAGTCKVIIDLRKQVLEKQFSEITSSLQAKKPQTISEGSSAPTSSKPISEISLEDLKRDIKGHFLQLFVLRRNRGADFYYRSSSEHKNDQELTTWLRKFLKFYKHCPEAGLNKDDFNSFIIHGRVIFSHPPDGPEKDTLPPYKDFLLKYVNYMIEHERKHSQTPMPPGYTFLKKIINDHKIQDTSWEIEVRSPDYMIITQVDPKTKVLKNLSSKGSVAGLLEALKDQQYEGSAHMRNLKMQYLQEIITNQSVDSEDRLEAIKQMQDLESKNSETLTRMDQALQDLINATLFDPKKSLSITLRIIQSIKDQAIQKDQLKNLVENLLQVRESMSSSLNDHDIGFINTLLGLNTNFVPQEKRELRRTLYVFIKDKAYISQYFKDLIREATTP